MSAENRSRRILSAVILAILMTVVSCFAWKSEGKEISAVETAGSAAEAVLAEIDQKTAGAGTDAQETQETEKDSQAAEDSSKINAAEEDSLVFGRGIESDRKLAEDVVQALKTGDTESLTGASFGDAFDYDLYEDLGREGCRRKEEVYDWYLRYFFEGEGHRFSGFSISSTGDYFLGVSLNKCPAAIFVNSFGEPDACEKTSLNWEGGVLRADWYFEKAVLSVEEYEGYVHEIAYKALGDAADGDGTEVISDFALRMEAKQGNEKVEAVYYVGFDEHEKDVKYPSEDDQSGARSAEEFVEKYLREQGLEGQMPDSTIYDEDGEKSAESYINEEKNKFVFVIYSGESVCCAVRDLPETDQTRHIVYCYDEAGNVVQETLYDKWGMRMAEASYQYHDGVPFPFLEESRNLSYEITDRFCRDRKTWFYEDRVELDRQGKVTALGEIDDWNAKEYLSYPCIFTYRPDGKLERIQEEIPQEHFAEELWDIRESYFGYMDFSYDGGTLKKIDYHRSGQVYSTTDQSGTVDFDKQGRMVHNYYYVTSGCHDKFYFYHEDEKRPWAVLDWCSDIWGVSVYLPMED